MRFVITRGKRGGRELEVRVGVGMGLKREGGEERKMEWLG